MPKIEAIIPSQLKEKCLKYIVHRELAHTNLRDFEHNYNRDLIIGLIGDRGSGKTLGGAQIAVRDYMVRNEPCYSNIGISPVFTVSDTSAQYWCGNKYNLTSGGSIRYAATPLDISKFLQFSDEYSEGVIFIDEINIALADARRSMSYQNLGSADVGQQLRKLKSALIYTCINEAYVDVRIRDLTDFVIKTRDAAFVSDRMPYKREGQFFHWTIHAMTDKAAAILGTYEKFIGKGGPLPVTHTISGKSWWDTIDTWEHQERRKYKKGVTSDVSSAITENQQIIIAKQDWGWLEAVANRIVLLGEEDSGKVLCSEVMGWPEVQEYNITQSKLSEELNKRFHIFSIQTTVKDGYGRRAQHYVTSQARVSV